MQALKVDSLMGKSAEASHTSSITNIVHSLRLHTPLLARSRTRPGVPTKRCTGWYRRIMSSRRLVPPVVTIICIFRCLASSLHTCEVCSASSLVGTKSKTVNTTRLLCKRSKKSYPLITGVNQHIQYCDKVRGSQSSRKQLQQFLLKITLKPNISHTKCSLFVSELHFVCKKQHDNA